MLSAILPPLEPQEEALLEANILRDGMREPGVTWHGMLLDGRRRREICQRHNLPFQTVEIILPNEQAAKIWIIQNQFGRRNLAPYSRVELALELEPLLRKQAKENQAKGGGGGKAGCQKSDKVLSHVDTKRELAKLAGVSHDTIAKGKLVAEHAPEETKNRLRCNQLSLNRVACEIKARIQQEARAKQRLAAARDIKMNSRIHLGDFRQLRDKIPDGSLSLIFTDPPYDREASKMLPDLAEFAASKLAEGGSLVSYVGHIQLPDAMNAFCRHLRYWWMFSASYAKGPYALMKPRGIRVKWKPLLWFVKGTRDDSSNIIDDGFFNDGQEKALHDWQQSEAEATYWIDKLCPKDGVVCDPFLGSGTTAAAAEKLGRRWLGFEIDKAAAQVASARLARGTADLDYAGPNAAKRASAAPERGGTRGCLLTEGPPPRRTSPHV
jgi:hypothetical protein